MCGCPWFPQLHHVVWTDAAARATESQRTFDELCTRPFVSPRTQGNSLEILTMSNCTHGTRVMHTHSRTVCHDSVQEYVVMESDVFGDNEILHDENEILHIVQFSQCTFAIENFMCANKGLQHSAIISAVHNMDMLLHLMESCHRQERQVFWHAAMFRYVNRFQEMMLSVTRLQNSTSFALSVVHEIIFNLYEMETFVAKHAHVRSASHYVRALLQTQPLTRRSLFEEHIPGLLAEHIPGQCLLNMLKICMEHANAKEHLLNSLVIKKGMTSNGISSQMATEYISRSINEDHVHSQIIIEALLEGLAEKLYTGSQLIMLLNPAFAPLPEESRRLWCEPEIKCRDVESGKCPIFFSAKIVQCHFFPLLDICNIFVLAWSCRFLHDIYASYYGTYDKCKVMLLQFDKLVETAARETL